MNTTEKNKLIAKFMGLKLNPYNEESCQNPLRKDKSYDVIAFNFDWNWLMEVVEKIKSLKETTGSGKGTAMVTKFDITNNSVTIAYENGDFYGSIYVGHTDNGKYFKHEGDVDTTKEAVYNACIKFIEWYNQQQK